KRICRLANQWRAALLCAMTFAFTTTNAAACTVCIELPAETLTDQLWSAETILFARPSTANPFTYEARSVIRGAVEEPIPFLVNATARRHFAQNSETAALVLRMPDGTWNLRGWGGEDFLQFVHVILANERTWSDEVDDPERSQAFRELHAHHAPNLRRFALTELSYFPYRDLKSLDVELPTDWIARRLFEASWFGWQPILVHLLGLHADPQAHDLVRRHAMRISANSRVPWLVALIEIDGETGVDMVVKQAISEGPSDEAADAAVRALAIHVDATPHLVEAIRPALIRLISDNPDLAAEAVQAFLRAQDFSIASEVSHILENGGVINPASSFVLTNYVAQARAAHMEVLFGMSLSSGEPDTSGAAGAFQ
ncbi:MAG: hypothetical protein AAF511_08500, partial [Pseudomonadota bacterium]